MNLSRHGKASRFDHSRWVLRQADSTVLRAAKVEVKRGVFRGRDAQQTTIFNGPHGALQERRRGATGVKVDDVERSGRGTHQLLTVALSDLENPKFIIGRDQGGWSSREASVLMSPPSNTKSIMYQ